jgi:hypothetical protein
MSDSLKYNIFEETECISEQKLFDYIDKKLSPRESHAIEKHMLHCELCSDALEGLETVKQRERIAVINQKVNERIASPIKETKVVPFNYKLIVSIAASVLLLIGGIFFFNLLNQKSEMAEFKPQSPLSEPPPPPPPSAKNEVSAEPENSTGAIQTPVEEEIQAEKKSTTNPAGNSINKGLSDGMLDQEQVSDETNKETSAADDIVSADETLSPRAVAATRSGSAYSAGKPESNGADRRMRQEKDANISSLEKSEDASTLVVNKGKADLAAPAPTPDGALSGSQVVDNISKNGEFQIDTKNVEIAGGAGATSEQRAKKKETAKERDEPVSIANSVSQSKVYDNDAAPETSVHKSPTGTTPEYIDGNDALMSFIHKNFNTIILQKNQQLLSQPLKVQFTITKKGSVKNIAILKGINTEVDKELLRVLNLMPKWKPGTVNGEAVSKDVSILIPLKK